MAFVHITDTKGETHLVHTSQIGLLPKTRRAQTVGAWSKVWARFDKDERR